MLPPLSRARRARVLPLLAVIASSLLVTSVASAQASAGKTDDTLKKKDDDKTKASPKPETISVGSDAADAAARPTAEIDKRSVFVALEGGLTRPDIGGLSDSTDFDKTAALGGLYGVDLGARFDKLIVGAAFRGDATTEFTLWSLMAEVGYALPRRPLQPMFFLRAGYTWSTELEQSVYRSAIPQLNTLPPDVKVQGGIVGVEAVAMYWIAKEFGVGPFLGFDAEYYVRPQVDLPQSLITIPQEVKDNPLYTGSGSAIGYTLNIGVRVALDLGI
jgi:hypothetical protein